MSQPDTAAVPATASAPAKPVLYLIPTILAPGTELNVLSPEGIAAIRSTRLFFAEELRTVRRFISKVGHPQPIDTLTFHLLDGKTPPTDLNKYAGFVRQFGSAGIISEAGCPAIADPGAEMVTAAHRHGITVKPLTGPCSFILALMGSGLGGQNFAFIGYLPQKKPLLSQALKNIEQDSYRKQQTQIFMDTPYRNRHLLEEILLSCAADTLLCLAVNLTAENEYIATKPVGEWKKLNYTFPDKVPAVFLLLKK